MKILNQNHRYLDIILFIFRIIYACNSWKVIRVIIIVICHFCLWIINKYKLKDLPLSPYILSKIFDFHSTRLLYFPADEPTSYHFPSHIWSHLCRSLIFSSTQISFTNLTIFAFSLLKICPIHLTFTRIFLSSKPLLDYLLCIGFRRGSRGAKRTRAPSKFQKIYT